MGAKGLGSGPSTNPRPEVSAPNCIMCDRRCQQTGQEPHDFAPGVVGSEHLVRLRGAQTRGSGAVAIRLVHGLPIR